MNAAGTYAMPDETSQSGRFVDAGVPSSERTYATFNHLVGAVSLASGGIPLGGLIGTLIMWRIKANESPFLNDHGREAVNFQLSLLTYAIGGSIALGIITVITFGFGAFLFPACLIGLNILNAIGCIRGAIAANRREYYRYPMCIRFISGD